MTDDLPNFKFSETVIQILCTYVVIRDVVEGVSMISEVPDWWLRPGRRKFTLDLNSSIANHGKAIWRYVLKRSAERSKVSLREFLYLSHVYTIIWYPLKRFLRDPSIDLNIL